MFFSRVAQTCRDISDGLGQWRIWSYMAWRDTASRYRRSLLGPFWIAGAMTATALSLSIVIGAIFRQPVTEILPGIMAGLMTWQLVSLPLTEGPELFLSQAGVMHNNNFPRFLYVMQFMLRHLIVTAHNVVVLTIVFLILQPEGLPTWQVIPGLLVVVLFATLLSPVTGLIAARYRDLRFMLPHIAQLLFFLTPIFWRVEDVDASRAGIYLYNPFYYLTAVLRDPIIGKPVPLEIWGVALAIVGFAAVAYLVTMSAFRRRLPFWI